MEFKRGKTFIKSSMQLTHEKLPLVDLNTQEKDDIGTGVKLGRQSEVEIQKAVLFGDRYDTTSNRATKTGSNERILLLPETFFKPVRKSKTHDCALGGDQSERYSGDSKSSHEGTAAPGKIKGRLVSSASFSGLGSAQNSSVKKESAVSSSHFLNNPQQMIDYRNFVPQMPFVPAVAKSIPRKRISLKRSKKGLRDIFHIKKNKPESLGLLSAKQKRVPFPGSKTELSGRFGKYFFKGGHSFASDSMPLDFSDGEMVSESSYEYASALCEDVASLKSFDSLTGCGEIFADESSAQMEMEVSKEILLRQSQRKENSAMGSFQGGVEQLASPAQNEAADFATFWDNINKSVQLHQKILFERQLLKISSSELKRATDDMDAPVTDLLSSPDSSKESSIDTGTPKSDNQESMSTSDEGYYDSFSPGLDDEVKEDQSPGIPGRFPRDSYSGDALYELFYDPSETQISPVLDDDLCISESISEKAPEIPLSIYSFHVGSEENMASQPAVDIVSQGFLHSTWKGKECLLKLCDTELSLTMGIINWLRKNPGLISPQDFPKSSQPQLEKGHEGKLSSPRRHQNICKTTPEDNKNHPETLSVDRTNGTQTYSVDRVEKDQSDISSCSMHQERSQEREGNLSATSGLITDNSLSSDLQRSEESWDKLLMSSSEMDQLSLLEGGIDPITQSLSLEVLNLETIGQTDEDFLAMDNHDTESCSSYMTAATSPDSLGTGDESEIKDQTWSIANDKPEEPLNLDHSPNHTDQMPKESNTNTMELLEHCVTQVASLNIGSKNKHVEDKCTVSEVSNTADTTVQLKNQLLLQNECNHMVPSSKDTPVLHLNQCINAPTLLNQKGLICFADQKNPSILDCMDSIVKNKLTFEYAQLNNQALSYIKDFRDEFCIQSPAMEHVCRPTFLPLVSSICSDTTSDLSQSWCRRIMNSRDHEVRPRGTTFHDYLTHEELRQAASLSLPDDATHERNATENKIHE